MGCHRPVRPDPIGVNLNRIQATRLLPRQCPAQLVNDDNKRTAMQESHHGCKVSAAKLASVFLRPPKLETRNAALSFSASLLKDAPRKQQMNRWKLSVSRANKKQIRSVPLLLRF